MERPRSTTPRLGMGGRELGRRAHGDDALAAHGERAVGQHRRRHGQHPVGAIDGDVVVRGDRLDRRSRHAGTQGQAPFVRKEYRGAPRTVANSERDPALPHACGGGILAPPATEGAACANDPGPASRPKSITSTVWDAIKDIPGVADLHRNPLQTLASGAHGAHGPVRSRRRRRPVLEVHLVSTGAASPLRSRGPPARLPRAHHRHADQHVDVYVDDVAAADE